MHKIIRNILIAVIGVLALAVVFVNLDRYLSERQATESAAIEARAAYEKKERKESEDYAKKVEEEREAEIVRLSQLNFFEKFPEEQEAEMFILGDEMIGSLGTQSDRTSWEYVLQQELLDDYKIPVKVSKSAFSGATAALGAITYEQMIGSSEPDLVVMSYGYNDQLYQDVTTFMLFYERLIRGIIKDYPETNFLLVQDYRLPQDDPYMAAVEKIGKYYNIDVIRPIGYESIDDDMKSLLLNDNGTLTYQGNILLAKRIRSYIDEKIQEGVSGITVTQNSIPLNSDIYALDNLNAIAEEFQSEGIEVFGDVSVAYAEGAYKTYITNKKYIFFSFVTSQDGGVITLDINGVEQKVIDTKGTDGSLVTVVLESEVDGEKLIQVNAKEINADKGQNNVKFLGISTN